MRESKTLSKTLHVYVRVVINRCTCMSMSTHTCTRGEGGGWGSRGRQWRGEG